MDVPSSPAVFAQVSREPTLPDKVTQLLLAQVMDGTLPAGTKLPSERELADQLGVSRTVVREAVRTLAAKGVLRVRSGSGVRIATIDASLVGESMKLYMRASGALDAGSYADLNEVRNTLEMRLVALACEHASAQELADLTAAHRAFEYADSDVESASLADVAFHRTIAEITHNKLYLVLLDAIGDVLLDIRRRTLRSTDRRAEVVAQHREILDAITSRDVGAASAAMSRHLDDSRRVQAELGGPPGAG